MAVVLGKRKRSQPNFISSSTQRPSENIQPEASDEDDVLQVFRRAFENNFKPLSVNKRAASISTKHGHELQDEEDSAWEGISEEDTEDAVTIVEHTTSTTPNNNGFMKLEKRAFMSARPPANTSLSYSKQTSGSPSDDDKDLDARHLQNDVALQKLLRESHLLGDGDTALSVTGATRHKATDLHLQRLGSKKSILTQEKMPMSHRKGIIAKAAEREGKRRKEARENGIILEKVAKVTQRKRVRNRGVGAPAVGRFKGGTLHLSRSDVASIQGPSNSGLRKGKRR